MQEPPDRIGRFEILGPLGEGAMGSVFRAVGSDGVEVALKTVSLAIRANIGSLRREIRALEAVEHPNVVRIVDQGVHDGLPWYAMTLVPGAPLNRHLKVAQSWKDRERLIPVLCDVCDGLAFLHGLGMVHRDLKPGNVVVRMTPALAGVLVDFGLATISSGGVGRELLYKRSEVAGTPQYISPEQVRQEHVDPRTDLYALGCMLYEILAGRPPFPAKVPIVAMLKHVKDRPTFDRDVVESTPAELRELTLALLEKSPRDRPGYAADVREVLARSGDMAHPAVGKPAPATYLFRPGFIGRPETTALLDRIAQDFASGTTTSVVIEGPSGAGKSRTAIELIRRLHTAYEQPLEVLMAEAPTTQERSNAPFSAMRRPFVEIADSCIERGRSYVETLLGADGALLASVSPAFGELPRLIDGHPPSVPPEQMERRLTKAAIDVLERFARTTPTVLVIDDLQWADALTRSLVLKLMKRRRDGASKLALVLLWRAEESDDVLEGLRSEPHTVAIHVGPLDRPAVEELIREMIAVPSVPSEFARTLFEQSGGLPLDVGEYLRTAVRRGLLLRVDGEWRFAGESLDRADTVEISATVDDMVAVHIDLLEPEAAELARIVAALGRETSADFLARIVGSSAEAAIDELLAEGIFEESGRGTLRFSHDRVREVVYDLTPDDERRRVHRRLAEKLAEGGNAELARVAFQWERAGEPEQAREAYRHAGLEHAEVGNFATAIGLLESYFRLDPAPSVASVEARCALAKSLHASRRSDEAREQQEASARDAAAIDEPVAQAYSDFSRAQFVLHAGALSDAIEAFDSARAIFEQMGDGKREREALLGIGNTWGRRGRFEVAADIFERVHDKAKAAGDEVGVAIALHSVGMTWISRRKYDAATSLIENAAARFEALGDSRRHADALVNLGICLSDCGQFSRAVTALERACDLRRSGGDLAGAGQALVQLGNAHLGGGDPHSAIASLEEAVEALADVKDVPQLAAAYGYLGEAYGVLKRSSEAMESFARAVELHRSLPYSELLCHVLLEMARLHRRLGLYVDADHYLDKARSHAPADGADGYFEVTHALELGFLSLARGKRPVYGASHLRAEVERMQLPPESRLAVEVQNFRVATRAAELVHGEALELIPQAFRPR